TARRRRQRRPCARAARPLLQAAPPSIFRCSLVGLCSSPARMHSLLDFIHRLRDVRALISWGGYVGLTAIIFAETGLLIGFLLPGDSLLVTAGLLAATRGVFNVYWL